MMFRIKIQVSIYFMKIMDKILYTNIFKMDINKIIMNNNYWVKKMNKLIYY